MRAQQINRVSGKALIVLSSDSVAYISGYTQPPQPDEGAAAHICLCGAHGDLYFQLPRWVLAFDLLYIS